MDPNVRDALHADVHRQRISTPEDVYSLLRPYHIAERERCFALYLDADLRLVYAQYISEGTEDSVAFVTRTMLRRLDVLDAPNLIAAHTHPDSPIPSHKDFELTRELMNDAAERSRWMLDHVVIGNDDCFSILQRERYNPRDNPRTRRSSR